MKKTEERTESFICFAGSLQKGNDSSVQVYFSRDRYIDNNQYKKLFSIIKDYIDDPNECYEYDIDSLASFIVYLFDYNDSGEIYIRIKNRNGIQEVRYLDGVLCNCSITTKKSGGEFSITSNEKGLNVQYQRINQDMNSTEIVNEANNEIASAIKRISTLYTLEKQDIKGKTRVKVG